MSSGHIILRGNRIKRAQRQVLINNTTIINFLILLSFDSASLLMNLHAIYYAITQLILVQILFECQGLKS